MLGSVWESGAIRDSIRNKRGSVFLRHPRSPAAWGGESRFACVNPSLSLCWLCLASWWAPCHIPQVGRSCTVGRPQLSHRQGHHQEKVVYAEVLIDPTEELGGDRDVQECSDPVYNLTEPNLFSKRKAKIIEYVRIACHTSLCL